MLENHSLSLPLADKYLTHFPIRCMRERQTQILNIRRETKPTKNISTALIRISHINQSPHAAIPRTTKSIFTAPAPHNKIKSTLFPLARIIKNPSA
jgi:hypothetical protein